MHSTWMRVLFARSCVFLLWVRTGGSRLLSQDGTLCIQSPRQSIDRSTLAALASPWSNDHLNRANELDALNQFNGKAQQFVPFNVN